MHFGGSGDARAKDRVQVHLLAHIKKAYVKEIGRDDFDEMYPLVAPPFIPSLPLRLKRSREREFETVAKLQQQVQHVGG